ncbi:methionine biosynthesis protein MetW [Acidithiobacillus thiooxidans]|jgi:methionine biosynthesis protein MetW|uniref:Methionine biosynthesis protein MetW n=2 Tax=Acidithiobacillus thiooxidans TaxID=930 RepID=A0A1C2JJ73_ACITH|nr:MULTISPECIES: methionine biosynthesis protein MetW [Acidithiobacillus]MBE7565479.1 methionine biosynthesis protein MetW [Acidithiobacillus sp. HP-11]MBU2742240.1 methionine biosynthesis protein MetW [Acidithiobacillus albertensis]MBU2750986.1 methionine biosynthesis protein MetW [Acidithiobacillus thiooxidans]MBU2795094.1 methionine biosynthesis protein MetW [Acidithiobacillus thiooxidans]MBU2810312.1 methionine biosynthesis protein MetW [Acidithiobacillus thiooxidans]
MKLRQDLAIIAEWIPPQSRILDLGCGEGELLAYLRAEKGVQGYGVEIEEDRVVAAIRRGIPVIQQDLDQGLKNFADQSVDTVVLSLTLQASTYPRQLLLEMLRVGREVIVTFPNMGHWHARWQLGVLGKMPTTDALPHTWYDTPNIHLCTIRDFEQLCADNGIAIHQRVVLNERRRSTWRNRLLPNLFGEVALYRCALVAR